MTKLKPCPFCGGTAEITGDFRMPYVQCNGCGVMTEPFKRLPAQPNRHYEMAAEFWNTRAVEQEE